MKNATTLQTSNMNLPQCMMFYILLLLVVIVQSDGFLYKEQLNVEELETLFGEEDCIEGSLSVTDMDNISIMEAVSKINENEFSGNMEDKSAMSMVNELAFFNKINYQYILTSEEGPPHQKQFNVSLHLGEEKYTAQGSSIKKAQHSAARQALDSTIYNHPPTKDNTKQIRKAPNRHNLVQKLEHWINKHLDSSVVYTFQGQSSRSHKNFYHDSMYSKPSLCKVTVNIGKLEFVGEGLTLDTAKQNAASNALKELSKFNGFCFLEQKSGNAWNSFFSADSVIDSPISLIHEFGSKSNQKVSFDLIKEEGPAHMRVFTFKCSIGERFITFAEGNNKKTAKKEAAMNMIKKLKSHAYDNNINCKDISGKSKKPKTHNSKKLVKAVEKLELESESHHSFSGDLNPVSKLMQIQQAYYDIFPIFTLLEERGEHVKEFFIEVKVGNKVFVGSGPNKKIAKRKAAEGMLEMLGYSHSSEGIRISLSEQKKKEFSNKHVSLPTVPISSGININSETSLKLDHNKESSHQKRSNPSGEYKKFQKVNSFNDDSAKAKDKIDMIVSESKSPKKQLDSISQKLGFRFQFSDFPKNNNTGSGFVSLLSLGTDPPKVCYGTGLTTDISQVKAAEAALMNLYKSHLAAITEILQEPNRDTVSEDWLTFGDTIFQKDVK